MENIEIIKNDFRTYLKSLNGIQGFGVSQKANSFHFIVNVDKKWFKLTHKTIPSSFKGINIELRKVENSRFLNII